MELDLPHTDEGPRAGEAVVLLHGFPLDHTMWGPAGKALAAAGFRVLAPDLRGLGRGPASKGTGSMAAFAGDVLRMTERAGLRRFALAGFSMGGYVALEVAREAPERLTGLALVDTRADADTDEQRKGRAALAERVAREGQQALVDAFLPKMFTPVAGQPVVEQTRAVMARTPVEGAVQALEAIAARADSRPVLAGLRVPVLVVVGAEDAVTPRDKARMMADLAKTDVVVVPGAHLTPLESPAEVGAALLAWARSF